MDKTIIVIDGFAPDIDGVADAARSLDYSPMVYEGVEYSGMSGRGMYFPAAALSDAMGFRVAPVETIFRCGIVGDKMAVWIHNDLGVAGAEWAAILYLTDPPAHDSSGTAFWRHVETGLVAQPSADSFSPEMAQQFNIDGQTMRPWQMDGYVAMRKNRLVIYPANRFHSRWPYRAFGSSPADGRLIWVGFFREGK